MPNYFDYMLESADSSIDDMDDCDVADSVYNEMDASMCEFDSYVQEGVGVAIAAVGGAALLTGLIALIAKCFGNSSSSSVSKSAKELKKAIEEAKAAGEPVPECKLPDVESIKNIGESVKKELDSCEATFEETLIINSSSTEGTSKTTVEEELKQGTTSVTVGEPYGDTKKPVHKHSQYLPVTYSQPKSWEDAKERVDAIIQVSNEITQKQKSLKKTEKKVQNAEKNGSKKLTQQQQNKLKQSQGKAGTKVSKSSFIFQKGINTLKSIIKVKSDKR